MTDPLPPSSQGGFLTRLSAPMLALIGVVTLVGVAAGGYYAYRTYDYVQHDNDFCMSCHLMQEPFEQFAKSEHRGLGCKACHQPNLIDRSTMALTQIIENPEALGVHAEVPNERCADCHIRGDPVKWRQIANSVGHRVHLESDDPSLEGLKCVECHSTGVHEFAPVDRTCSQSGCHEDNVIRLGGMGQLTIHCAACHTFVAPVSMPGDSPELLEAAILPDQDECLSCHVMRTLVTMPDPDPHRGVCASCHNPHVQETPRQAVESCTSAGCHSGPDTLTAFHRGLSTGVLEGCLNCHQAHDFAAEGLDCRSCHTGIDRDSLGVTLPFEQSHPIVTDTGGGGALAHRPTPTAPAEALPSYHGPSESTAAQRYLHGVALVGPEGVGLGWGSAATPQQTMPFLHSEHRDVGCGNCHSNEERHGALTVSTLSDCRDCHHTAPVARSCARCHDAADVPPEAFQVTRTIDLSVSDPQRRTMPFVHAQHEGLDCASCHAEGSTRSASNAECATCHEDHHEPTNQCSACHTSPPVSAHPPSEAHVTCSGSACHQTVPFETVPRTRETCLGCHQTMRDHRPGERCSECHTLPEPRRSGVERDF